MAEMPARDGSRPRRGHGRGWSGARRSLSCGPAPGRRRVSGRVGSSPTRAARGASDGGTKKTAQPGRAGRSLFSRV